MSTSSSSPLLLVGTLTVVLTAGLLFNLASPAYSEDSLYCVQDSEFERVCIFTPMTTGDYLVAASVRVKGDGNNGWARLVFKAGALQCGPVAPEPIAKTDVE